MLKLNGNKITQSKLPATRHPDKSGDSFRAAGCGDPRRNTAKEQSVWECSAGV